MRIRAAFFLSLVPFLLITVCFAQSAVEVVPNNGNKIVVELQTKNLPDSNASENSLSDNLKTWAPYVAALVALIGVFYTLRRGKMDARFAFASEIHQYRVQQVTEFYAPALLLIQQSKIIYDKLIWTMRREQTDFVKEEFKLLDQIAELKADTKFQPIITELINVNDQLTKLISEKAGLIEGEITKPYFDYQGHIAILKAAGEQNLSGDKKDGWHELGYFPREINAEIENGYKTVLAHIKNYSSAGDEIIDELIR